MGVGVAVGEIGVSFIKKRISVQKPPMCTMSQHFVPDCC